MTSTPNPTISVSTIDGTTRTLDDWTTITSQCWIILPSKLEALQYIGVSEQIFKTFGDSSARCAFLIPGNIDAAKEIIEKIEVQAQFFVDEDFSVCKALGVEYAPTLLYIRQDTSVAHIAQGFNYSSWSEVCGDIAKSLRWTKPKLNEFSQLPDAKYLVV